LTIGSVTNNFWGEYFVAVEELKQLLRK
jgi:hypothetical protein